MTKIVFIAIYSMWANHLFANQHCVMYVWHVLTINVYKQRSYPPKKSQVVINILIIK